MRFRSLLYVSFLAALSAGCSTREGREAADRAIQGADDVAAAPVVPDPPPKTPAADGERMEPLAWGTAVEGIQIAARPVRGNYGPGEEIEYDILYRNVSDREITVCVHGDPFYVWTWTVVRYPGTGQIAAAGPHANGVRPALERSDFVTLPPGGAAQRRETIRGGVDPPPGQYTLQVAISKINRMEKYIHGFDEMCRKHHLAVWTGVAESALTPLAIIPFPEAAWGGKAVDLECGIGAPDLSAPTVAVPALLRVGVTDKRLSFRRSQFGVEFDGKRYVTCRLCSKADAFDVARGQDKGMTHIIVGHLVPAGRSWDWWDSPHPLARLAPGPHRIRLVYHDKEAKVEAPSAEITFEVPPGYGDRAPNPEHKKKEAPRGFVLQGG